MKIIKLPEHVISKIAAGEVITSYSDILKELLENSLDAGATEININIPEKVSHDNLIMEIRDNGTGIEKDNFNLLCERHCTSKFKSLSEITTFGFRGEALASISLIADIIVESLAEDDYQKRIKKNEKIYGYVAKYINGKLESIKPKGMIKGTVIRIYRKETTGSIKIEKRDLMILCINYQLNNPNVRIIMNEMGAAYLSLLNPINREKIIQYFYKTGDLIMNETENHVFITSYPLKKFTFILFINNRLVNNSQIKNEILKIYKEYFPVKRFPFVFLSIKIDEVDVNIHPRKQEVLLYELPSLNFITELLDDQKGIKRINKMEKSLSEKKINLEKKKKIYSDPNSSTLDESFFSQIDNSELKSAENLHNTEEKVLDNQKKIYNIYNFMSIKKLRAEQSEIDNEFFKNLVFIGTYENMLYVQKDSSLLECKINDFLRIFFYQKILFGFGNFNSVFYKKRETEQEEKFLTFKENENNALKTKNLLTSDLNDYKSFSKNIGRRLQLLNQILKEYFSINFDKFEFPIVSGFTASLDEWYEFYKKIENVEWDDEKDLFEQIMRKMSMLFLKINIKLHFKMMKNEIIGSKEAIEIFQILTNLRELYKHFERC